jgi:cobalt/nickel transport system permease protein
VLPAWLWGGGLALAVALLLIGVRLSRGAPHQSIALRGALGGLVLVAMALELPLGPIEYHLSLVGPVGVLVGPAGAFQLIFVVSAILAFAGHGGFTVVGLNALILGAGAAPARPLYRRLASALAPAPALALTAAACQALSGLLWIAVMALALRSMSAAPTAHAPSGARVAVLGAFALPLWAAGVLIESSVAYALARFLARVRPDLLPMPSRPRRDRATGESAVPDAAGRRREGR